LVGLRIPKACDISSKYFSVIDDCVSLAVASNEDFIGSFFNEIYCHGGVITSPDAIEGLRFCTVIVGGLTINANDSKSDFTALFDIQTIHGM
jgi:hypothetical protein